MGFLRHQQGRQRIRAWRLALVLLALLATGAQQLVVQTHWHAAAAAVVADSDSAASAPGQQPVHDDCLWCQIAAHAGAAAPPANMLRLAVVAEFLAPVSQRRPLVAVLQPAHAWQSRGPPPV